MRIEYIYKISRKELKRKRKNRYEKFGKLFGIFKLKKKLEQLVNDTKTVKLLVIRVRAYSL